MIELRVVEVPAGRPAAPCPAGPGLEQLSVHGLRLWLGLRIRTARTQRGLTQRQLAAAAGMHHNYLYRLEKGRQGIEVATLARLAAGLGTTLTDLLNPNQPL